MAKRYNNYKFNEKEKFESRIFPVEDNKENNIVINSPVTINNEITNEVNSENNMITNTTIQNKIVTVYCNVRKAPNGEIQTTYQAGTEVKVVEEIDDWSKLNNGLFIRSDLLK